ncbi:maleylpyruvate isomerase N-terminal domain-containing protein [Streptomyces sp. ICC4]|uniref:maleylpyruvate isomerase N-terminal domain-containing protein n=1 Tax=Streptomyces sp. ICC4 TaxID=2099584 RepID=UPI0031BA7D48
MRLPGLRLGAGADWRALRLRGRRLLTPEKGATVSEIVLLEKALNHTTGLLGNVTPDQYGQPTPCEDFDVRSLANHLVAGNPYYVTLAQGGGPDFSLFARDQIGDEQPGDLLRTRRQGSARRLAGRRRPGAADAAARRRHGSSDRGPAPA